MASSLQLLAYQGCIPQVTRCHTTGPGLQGGGSSNSQQLSGISTDFRDDDGQIVGFIDTCEDVCKGVEVTGLASLHCIRALNIGAVRDPLLDVARSLVNCHPVDISGVSLIQHIGDESRVLLLNQVVATLVLCTDGMLEECLHCAVPGQPGPQTVLQTSSTGSPMTVQSIGISQQMNEHFN